MSDFERMRGLNQMHAMILAGSIGMILAGNANAQQPAPQQKPNFQILIEQQLGDLMVKGSICAANLDTVQGTLAQRDKTIADLQAELAALKKEPPK